jgi:uncharacterized protein YoxC
MLTPLGLAFLQAASRDGLSVAADASIIIVAVAVVVLAIVLAIVLARVSKVLVEVRNGVRTHLGPISERARGIGENVEFITRTIREDVDKLNGSVTAVTDKLKLASERMEERIEEFNALMEVVQEEAEDVFIDTAATVRGVRAGARAVAGRRGAAGVDSEEVDRGTPEPEQVPADTAQASPEPQVEEASEPQRAGALAAENG